VLRLALDTAARTGAVGNFNYLTNGRAGATTVRSTAAAYVRDGSFANGNFGSDPQLLVKKFASPYDREAYVKFDIGSLATVGTAKLRLYGSLQDALTASAQIGIYATGSGWSEPGITWNTRPAAGTQQGAFTVTGTTAKWYEADLTSFVKAEKAAGRATIALALKSLTPAVTVCAFASDEAVNGPELVIAG
jgi:hypothetical protein